MGNSSSVPDPSAEQDRPYISKQLLEVIELKNSHMTTSMDTHMSQHDDLSLMGLQELDSHLSIFESNLGRDSSTPGATSSSAYGESISTVDNPSTTIIVELPKKTRVGKSVSSSSHDGKVIPRRSVSHYVNSYIIIAPSL
jgi:hypothetical protein